MLNFINFLCCSSDKQDTSNLEEQFHTTSARREKKSTKTGLLGESRDTRCTSGSVSRDTKNRFKYSNDDVRNSSTIKIQNSADQRRQVGSNEVNTNSNDLQVLSQPMANGIVPALQRIEEEKDSPDSKQNSNLKSVSP